MNTLRAILQAVVSDKDLQASPPPDGLERVVYWLDEAVTIPGTNVKVGLDAVAGLLLPGVGDTATLLAGLVLVVAAMRERAPAKVVARMIGNLLIDALVGAVPVLGDLFDISFRANRRNLELLKAHRTAAPAPLTGPEKLALLAVAGAVVTAAALPVLAALGVYALLRA